MKKTKIISSILIATISITSISPAFAYSADVRPEISDEKAAMSDRDRETLKSIISIRNQEVREDLLVKFYSNLSNAGSVDENTMTAFNQPPQHGADAQTRQAVAGNFVDRSVSVYDREQGADANGQRDEDERQSDDYGDEDGVRAYPDDYSVQSQENDLYSHYDFVYEKYISQYNVDDKEFYRTTGRIKNDKIRNELIDNHERLKKEEALRRLEHQKEQDRLKREYEKEQKGLRSQKPEEGSPESPSDDGKSSDGLPPIWGLPDTPAPVPNYNDYDRNSDGLYGNGSAVRPGSCDRIGYNEFKQDISEEISEFNLQNSQVENPELKLKNEQEFKAQMQAYIDDNLPEFGDCKEQGSIGDNTADQDRAIREGAKKAEKEAEATTSTAATLAFCITLGSLYDPAKVAKDKECRRAIKKICRLDKGRIKPSRCAIFPTSVF